MIVDLKSWNHPRIPEIAGFLSQDVARLGVTCVETPEGVTEDVWEEGVTICIQTKRCKQHIYTIEHCVGEKELKTNKLENKSANQGTSVSLEVLDFCYPRCQHRLNVFSTFSQWGRLALPGWISWAMRSKRQDGVKKWWHEKQQQNSKEFALW